MANITTFRSDAASTDGTLGPVARLRAWFTDWQLYRATLDELQSLNDRELADLGLSRHSIRDIAYESVYGN